jgi:hypothetical protein
MKLKVEKVKGCRMRVKLYAEDGRKVFDDEVDFTGSLDREQSERVTNKVVGYAKKFKSVYQRAKPTNHPQ